MATAGGARDELEHEIGAWEWDLASGQLTWSAACRRIVGLGPEAPCDYRTFLELVPHEERELHARAMDRALHGRGDPAFHCEHRIRRPDGATRWIVWQGRVLSDERGRPSRVLGTVLDVTPRVVATNEALALRDRLLSVLSHDLRTPLTAIDLGGAVLMELADRSGNRLARRHIELIRRNAARLGGLIGDVVDMASIEAGRLALMSERVPLAPIVADALRTVERSASDRRVQLSSENRLDDSSRLDRERVVRALSALLTAALERSPRGGTVRLRAARHDGEVRFEVLDTAPTVGPDERRSLLELVGGPRRLVGRCAGRLYVARGIAEAHGGRLEVRGGSGDGNLFALVLPFRPGGAP